MLLQIERFLLFFLWLSTITWYICTTCLSNCLLMGSWDAPIFGLVKISLVLCALEKNVCIFCCFALKVSIKSIWSNVLFQATVSFIFCLEDLSIDGNGVLKSPTVNLSFYVHQYLLYIFTSLLST